MGYVHLFPPHSPYTTRSEFYDRFQDGWQPPRKPEHFFSEGYSQQFLDEERRLYDESIAYVDAEFGRLFDSLENAGLLKNTYLMLTSDHGEMFERGITKHNTPTLNEPIVHIPQLVSAPGQSQRQDVYTPTSNIDLLPTLCGIAGRPIPPQSEGQGLALTGLEHGDTKRPVFIVEAKENPRNAPLHKATIAMIQGIYKLIYTFGYENYPPTFELYDLETDPEEFINLYSETDLVSLTLKDQLLTKLAEVNQQ
jgi:choline-sulfatase